MNLIILVPNVVKRYIASFPEVTNNAYKYFNYDHRVVQERVPRFDMKVPYRGPEDFSNMDYNGLVEAAKGSLNKLLAKYSMDVACEDALHVAIRSYANGLFDGKINASRYNVLLCELKKDLGITPSDVINYRHANLSVEARKKKEKEETRILVPHVLRQLGLKRKDVPRRERVRVRKGIPHLVRTEKGVEVKKTSNICR